jgi:hypothetical protein
VQPELQQGLTLEALHSLFSAHGFVKKMATYARPEGGLLAWAQFPDAATATAVGAALRSCCGIAVVALCCAAQRLWRGPHVLRRCVCPSAALLLQVCVCGPGGLRTRQVGFFPVTTHAARLLGCWRCLLLLQVKNALQGQPVPPHLVNNHPSPPTLDLAFSASPDLPIRTQSPSTRWVERRGGGDLLAVHVGLLLGLRGIALLSCFALARFLFKGNLRLAAGPFRHSAAHAARARASLLSSLVVRRCCGQCRAGCTFFALLLIWLILLPSFGCTLAGLLC